MHRFYVTFALTLSYFLLTTIFVVAAILFFTATPAIAKDRVICTPKGGCHEGIRPW